MKLSSSLVDVGSPTILFIKLKKVLNKIIDSKQSTFLEGRGLMDSILVANKVLEEVKRKKKNYFFLRWTMRRFTTM